MGSRNFGEAGRYFYIFTRDLGLVYASAQGVRKLSSKLRYTLQDFAYINVDLVRGKDFWRITTASRVNKLENLSKNMEVLKVFVNTARLLKRLLAGEDKNEELFTDLVRGLEVLEQAHKEELRHIEVLLVLRILYHLGYIGGENDLSDCLLSPLAGDLVFKVSAKRKNILREINQALRQTHL